MPTWEQAPPQSKSFECSVAWHLRDSGLMLAIYVKLGELTNGGKSHYFTSVRKLAIYFFGKESRGSYQSVLRAFRNLTKMGWLERDKDGYRYVPHWLWAERNKGKCCGRGTLLPWQESPDEFVGKIWKASGGKLRVHAGMVAAARKYCTEEQFLHDFQHEMDSATANRVPGGDWQGTSPKQCFWRVVKFFKEAKEPKPSACA